MKGPAPASCGRGRPDGDPAAYVAALAGLPGMGPATLAGILERWSPEEAWALVRNGRLVRPGGTARATTAAPGSDRTAVAGEGEATLFGPPPKVRQEWSPLASRVDPPAWWSRLSATGVGVTWPGRPDYPSALSDDPQKPGALFYLGRLDFLERVCVAVVGTRRATPQGRAVAFEMGRDLAAAGVCVVSGLALGIDGAAHAGALRAVRDGAPGSTVGVAASGVDVPYPARHRDLWRQVAAAGAVVSENLPGRPAQAWRFPSRNRVIAGLVAMVVVVESHATGGSLITAEAAMARGVDVRVVPGPVQSAAHAGSNQLLYDGPGPVRHAQDVLDALGIVLPASAPTPDRRRGRAAAAPAGSPEERALTAIGIRPATLDQVMARSGLDPAAAIAALEALRRAGSVVEEGGYWSALA